MAFNFAEIKIKTMKNELKYHRLPLFVEPTPAPSKTTQRKCKQGLHEYMNNKCIYCEKILSEHKKTI